MGYRQIRYALSERVATISLARPGSRNAFTQEMAGELAEALTRADEDEQVRCVVLTGEGADFCVGADLSGGSLTAAEGGARGDWVEPATQVTSVLYRLSKPVIAALRGAAVGVGSTMVLPADYRLAADDARFGFVFARRGLYPEGGSAWFLPRLVGLGRALDWMISGRLIAVEEAQRAGLVHSVHAPDELLPAAHRLARELVASTAPVSVAVIRQTLYRMSGLAAPDAQFDLDSRLIASCLGSPDAEEGIASFLQRRAPSFPGTVAEDLPTFLPWQQG